MGNSSETSGLVFDIQSYSVHDGPGCRTTIFLSGCYLQCRWCANPESWGLRRNILFVKSKCLYSHGCSRCLDACQNHAISTSIAGELLLNREVCRQCTELNCGTVCPVEAFRICGRWFTPESLMKVIKRDRDFWGPKGGVTFGGGEPLFQSDFLNNMLEHCKSSYIHTALETTAYAPEDAFLRIMQNVDFAFVDVKHMDTELHQKYTGAGNAVILSNIAALKNQNWSGRLVLRMPVIPDFNDSLENAAATADFMDEQGLYEINILPFHRLGDSKWEQLGKVYDYQQSPATPSHKMEELQRVFLQRRIACYVGGDTLF